MRNRTLHGNMADVVLGVEDANPRTGYQQHHIAGFGRG